MKAKTKDQLRGEIISLQVERDSLKQTVERVTEIIGGILFAFFGSLRSTLVPFPNAYEAFAHFVTSFFAELKQITDVDFSGEDTAHFVERLTDLAGFDEVTLTVIRQRIQPFFEVGKMIRNGKSDKEIREFIKKCREAEGRG